MTQCGRGGGWKETTLVVTSIVVTREVVVAVGKVKVVVLCIRLVVVIVCVRLVAVIVDVRFVVVVVVTRVVVKYWYILWSLGDDH
jgi:hypothetical protein